MEKVRKGFNQVIFRTSQERECEVLTQGLLAHDEWATEGSLQRISEASWNARYDYEAGLLAGIVKDNNIRTILELGPGPGVLCSKLLALTDISSYSLVDIEAAYLANKERKLGGDFYVENLNNGFTTQLPNKVDLLIANDFLEHIQSPAKVLLDVKEQMSQDAFAFISVPNWRMGHAWIYRGLFDWDNFIHFMWQHGFEFIGYADSPIKCGSSPKLSSESTMPDDMTTSWNFYFVFKRNDQY
jgi:SAM-dependent methyltransferase